MPLRTELISSAFEQPVFMTVAPGDDRRLFVVERAGRIRVFDLETDTLRDEPFLEIAGLTQGDEQGLLGLAFHPQFAQNRRFFVNVTIAGGTPGGNTQIQAYQATDDLSAAVPQSKVVVLQVTQPFVNHNGGWLGFSPRDGFLYAALGDGGSANDPGRRGQNLGELLGKMLRLDVDDDDFPGDALRNYAIPPSNPFVGQSGARPEIWAFGLRNPWRCSFDRATGDLYIGDVGQNQREEIDVQPAASAGGENYGWRLKEGKRVTNLDPIAGQNLVDPIFDYRRDDGIAVVGGYVYRGGAVIGLAGAYFFADHTGAIWTLRWNGADAEEVRRRETDLFPQDAPFAITSFGEDSAGELYLSDLGGSVYRIAGSLP